MHNGTVIFIGIMMVALLILTLVPPVKRNAGLKQEAPRSSLKLLETTIHTKPHPACGFFADGRSKPGIYYCADVMTLFGVKNHCRFVRCAFN